jgi:hypothetical protein
MTPFNQYTNGMLVFKLQTGGYTVDARTGNRLPVIEERKIQAMVDRPERQNVPDENSGNDREVIRLRGRTTDPPQLPSWVRVGSVAQLTLTDRASGSKQTGRFTLTSVQQSPFPQISMILGSIFEGDFKTERGGEVSYESAMD